jgi:hypothetical protein
VTWRTCGPASNGKKWPCARGDRRGPRGGSMLWLIIVIVLVVLAVLFLLPRIRGRGRL